MLLNGVHKSTRFDKITWRRILAISCKKKYFTSTADIFCYLWHIILTKGSSVQAYKLLVFNLVPRAFSSFKMAVGETRSFEFRLANTMKCLRFVWIMVSDCRKQTGPPDAGNNLRKCHFIMCHVTKYSTIRGVLQQPWPFWTRRRPWGRGCLVSCVQACVRFSKALKPFRGDFKHVYPVSCK